MTVGPSAEVGGSQLGIVTEAATLISVTDFAQALENSALEPLSRPSKEESGDAKHEPDEASSSIKEEIDRGDSSTSTMDNRPDSMSMKPVPVTGPRTSLRRRLGTVFSCVPRYAWAAIAVFVVVEVLVVTGSIYYTRSINQASRQATVDVARSSARAIEQQLDHLIAPMLSLANLVHLQPHWPTLNQSFPTFADAIYQTNPYFQIELCPYGLVAAMAMPWANATGNLTSDDYWQMMLSFEFGLDLLDDKRPSFPTEIGAIFQNGSVILLGPWYMPDGELAEGAFVVRYSILLPPGNWNMPESSIANCPYDVCNTHTGLTWWGWSNAIIAWKSIAHGLRFIEDRGLLYTLAPDYRAENQSYLARSPELPNADECEVVYVDVFGWMSWTFCVEPRGGFGPSWRVGLLVGVTALAVLLAALTGLMLRSRDQAVQYLAKQLELNRQLAVAKEEAEEGHRVIAAEKRVMDALVQRQRNLIELFGKEDELMAGLEGDEATQRRLLQNSGTQNLNASYTSTMSRESAAMDRIEAVRRQLTHQRSTKQSSSPANEVKLLDMLGEGSFGKVYRGLWRGTDVAVKTMVLPANMSGAEKREKMAIMEAAISSSLAHPNIVQTYTYFIKTVREEASTSEDGSQAPGEGILVGGAAVTELSGLSVGASTAVGNNKTFDVPSSRASSQAVHGYEVRLVLEFCDRGCLRDALDGDAFLCTTGVNYAGVLDTAADIAKAMLHLHLADVLHGDLKARNVMLKSSGTEGRGVIGKVADFGLAVKIDTVEQTHMSGMYQGTLTHMAPELLLHGRMSKAVDVYAFGITLWELFTGGHAFQGVPCALLGHQIAQERKRPSFPPFVPEAYMRLASDCWAHNAEERPTFEVILERLGAMRGNIAGPAAPLAAYEVGAPPPPPPMAPVPALPKLADGAKTVSNSGFSASGAGAPGMIVGGGGWDNGGSSTSGSSSGGGGGGGSIGSGMVIGTSGGSINWMLGRAVPRTQLAVVEEDDREMDISSKKLPQMATPQRTPHLSDLPSLPKGGAAPAEGGVAGVPVVLVPARGDAELLAPDLGIMEGI